MKFSRFPSSSSYKARYRSCCWRPFLGNFSPVLFCVFSFFLHFLSFLVFLAIIIDIDVDASNVWCEWSNRPVGFSVLPTPVSRSPTHLTPPSFSLSFFPPPLHRRKKIILIQICVCIHTYCLANMYKLLKAENKCIFSYFIFHLFSYKILCLNT